METWAPARLKCADGENTASQVTRLWDLKEPRVCRLSNLKSGRTWGISTVFPRWTMSLIIQFLYSAFSCHHMFCRQVESLAGFWAASLKRVSVTLNELWYGIYVWHCDKLPIWLSLYNNHIWCLFHE